MAPKKAGGRRGTTAEDEKEKSNSVGSGRVLRSRSTTKGEGKADDEKAKGRKPMAKKGTLTIHDGAEKAESSGKRKVTTEMESTPAKRKRNAGEDEKGKGIVIGSERVLRSHGAKQGGRNVDDKAKGKGKLVVEENPVKATTPVKRRNASKEIVVSSAGKSSYNLRARKVVQKTDEETQAGKGSARKKAKLGKEMTGTVQKKSAAQSQKRGNAEKAGHAASKKPASTRVSAAKTQASQKPKKIVGRVKAEKSKKAASTSVSAAKTQASKENKKDGGQAKAEKSKKTVLMRVSASKTQASKKTKKDGGQDKAEKSKNPAGKGRSNAGTKK